MFFATSHAIAARVVDRVAVVVNDQIILQSDIETRIRPMQSQLRGIPDAEQRQQRLKQLKLQVLDQLIADALIAQEAEKLKMSVEDRELDQATEMVMRRNNLSVEQFSEALRQEGLTLQTYKTEMLKPQILRQKVVNTAVRSRIAISEKELLGYYHKNMKELGVEARVHARHIFIMVPDGASDAVRAERKQFSETLLNQLKAGSDFAELAKAHSNDSITRESGGDLGFVTKGTLPSQIEDEVFAMKPKEIRGPLASSHGFHLIQVLEREESSARPYEEVKAELQEQIYAEKMEKATQVWLTEMRGKSFIDVKVKY